MVGHRLGFNARGSGILHRRFHSPCIELQRFSSSTLRAWELAVVLTTLIGASTATQAATRHGVGLRDLRGFTGAQNLRLSPDGRMLAYVTATDGGPLSGTVWLSPTKAGSTPRKIGEGFLPLWSPNGTKLAYYSHKSKSLQLWIFDLATNRSRPVTRLRTGIDPDPSTRLGGWIWDPFRYSWSPDGRQLVFASRVAVREKQPTRPEPRMSASPRKHTADWPLVLTTRTPPELAIRGVFTHGFGDAQWKNGTVVDEPDPKSAEPTRRVSQLFVVAENPKLIRQLTQDEAGYFNPLWSPDGQTIVCASNEGRPVGGFGATVTNIYAISPVNGAKTRLTSGPGNKWMPEWSSDGQTIAFLASERSGTTSVVVSPRTGGSATNVTARLDRSVVEFQWVFDHNFLLANYVDGVSWSIARIDIATSHIEPLSDKQSAFRSSITVSRSGTLAWMQDDPTTPAAIYVLPAGEDSPYVLRDLNPQVGRLKTGAQEVIRWRNDRGDELEGVLIEPVDYQKGKRYPLIVDTYSGQGNTFKGNAMLGNQAWAARGYAVFWPNARAPHEWENHFKSAEYDQAARGPKGWDVTVDDVMSGTSELVRRGIVDPDRMCLYGFSNGAGIVNYLVTRTDRFKCAVSVSGISDWMSIPLLTGDQEQVVEGLVGNSNPWENTDDYVQISAVFHLKSVVTPMLLAAGDEEDGFLLNTIEMYSGLRRLGKDVVLLRYPKQDHGFTGDALADFWGREMAFFHAYLLPRKQENDPIQP